jgi:hypothetical protein
MKNFSYLILSLLVDYGSTQSSYFYEKSNELDTCLKKLISTVPGENPNGYSQLCTYKDSSTLQQEFYCCKSQLTEISDPDTLEGLERQYEYQRSGEALRAALD